MNTKKVTDKDERKKLKRAARKKVAPKAKRAADVARGSQKRKVKKMVKGQRKRWATKPGRTGPAPVLPAACPLSFAPRASRH
jgi:hypothetical protein